MKIATEVTNGNHGDADDVEEFRTFVEKCCGNTICGWYSGNPILVGKAGNTIGCGCIGNTIGLGSLVPLWALDG